MALPRVVIATRATELEQLLARHGTEGQARFFLESRGRRIEPVVDAHQECEAAVLAIERAVPARWRRMRVDRGEFNRFLFEPEDVVVAVGQDGLVANLAKYLSEQVVIGVNPSPIASTVCLRSFQRRLRLKSLLEIARGAFPIEERAMVEARLDDGQTMTALNELFIGHATHQSARYRLEVGGASERQSSSGIVVATGTGATGWARSISAQRGERIGMPAPDERELVWFVREAFPSLVTGTELTMGVVRRGESFVVHSELELRGVVFGDGIESDSLEFNWGRRLEVVVSPRVLRLAAG